MRARLLVLAPLLLLLPFPSGPATGLPCPPVVGCGVVPEPDTFPRHPCDHLSTSFSFSASTGVDAQGQPLAQGLPDANWTLEWQPPSGTPGPAFSQGPTPTPGWVVGTSSAWINHNPTSPTGLPGQYVYSTSLAVPTMTEDVRVEGAFAAADSATLSIDDGSTSTIVAASSGPNAWTGFSVGLPGTGFYTLRAVVENSGEDDFGTGLHVNATVSGRCKAPGPVLGLAACAGVDQPKFHFLLNTGIDDAGNVRPSGAPELHWTAVSFSNPATAFSHGLMPHGSYVSDPSAAWINFDPAWTDEPASVVDYHVTYVLPPGASGVTVTGKLAADNSAYVQDFDSTNLNYASSTAPDAYTFWTPFSYAVQDTGSYHVLSAIVQNDLWAGGKTPTGLVVVAEVSGSCA